MRCTASQENIDVNPRGWRRTCVTTANGTQTLVDILNTVYVNPIHAHWLGAVDVGGLVGLDVFEHARLLFEPSPSRAPRLLPVTTTGYMAV